MLRDGQIKKAPRNKEQDERNDLNRAKRENERRWGVGDANKPLKIKASTYRAQPTGSSGNKQGGANDKVKHEFL